MEVPTIFTPSTMRKLAFPEVVEPVLPEVVEVVLPEVVEVVLPEVVEVVLPEVVEVVLPEVVEVVVPQEEVVDPAEVEVVVPEEVEVLVTLVSSDLEHETMNNIPNKAKGKIRIPNFFITNFFEGRYMPLGEMGNGKRIGHKYRYIY